ncbi:MAG: hypothetical protein ABI688_03330 [Bacteroidota bacterium]
MKKIKALAIFNAVSLLIHISIAYFIQAKMISNQDVGEVSAKYESLFTPAGITFGIWGIIYITLCVLCLYHIIIAYKHDKPHPANTDLLRINGWFILVNLASAAWLIAWVHEELALSVVLIFVQLLGLAIIHQRLHLYDPLKPASLKLATQFPISIYLGWISIAAIANTSSYLSSIKWDGFGISASKWAIILISASLFLSALMIFVRKNIHFGLVIAWGLYGIIVKRQATDTELYEPVIITAWTAMGLILLFSVVQLIRNISYKRPRDLFPAPVTPIK